MPSSVRSTDRLAHSLAVRGASTTSGGRRRTRRVSLCSSRLLGLAALLAATSSAIAHDVGEVDSGWSVARPATRVAASTSTAPQMRILLDHVLKPTEERRLETDSPPAHRAMRVAERAMGIKGWRPIGGAAPIVQPPSDRPEMWQSRTGATATSRVESPPPALIVNPGNESLEFRSPLASGSRGGEPAAASVRRPNPLPSDELTPELLPGGDWLWRNGPVDATVSKPLVDRQNDDDCSGGDRPEEETNSDDQNGATADETDAALPDDLRVALPGDAKSTSPENVAVPTVVASAPPPLTPQLKSLRTRLRSVLKGYYQKSLNSQEHDPWEVMHGMLAYGIHSRIRQGGPRGDYITSVGWLCYNRPCKGKSLLYVTPEGELRAKQGVGLQGHMGQLLAMLAQSRVSPDYPIRVGSHEFTVQELVEAEQKTCYPKSELTFKLIAFANYLDLDATWVNDQGLDWDFPRLINEELAQPIRGAACGGTHRLSGLSLAVKARQKSGGPLDGEYGRAAEFVKNYQNYAFRLQNRDGSLSTKWFQGQGDESDTDRRVKTTGHILEWLIYSLSDDELRDHRTVRAVTYLTNLLYSDYDHEWEVGPISHATHALLLYDERVFQPLDSESQKGITTRAGGSNTAGGRGGAGRR